jgi:uncharacterized protein YhjY with autotransporter beta-barrel domain
MADISEHEELSARQARAIAALLSEPSIRKAAEASDIPERTIYAWLKDDLAFQASYREARSAAVQQATAQLQRASTAAVNVLCQLLKSDKAPAVRLGAARAILEFAFEATKLDDLAARIAALEEQDAARNA